MRNKIFGLVVMGGLVCGGLGATLPLAGCHTAPKSQEGKDELTAKVDTTMTRAESQDPTLKPFLDKAYGYAVFPTVGKGAVGVGGAYGKGQVFEQGKRVAFCDLTQASIGLALGGQAYTEILVFENKAAFDNFRFGKLKFAAQATAVVLHSGAGANAKYTDGVSVMTMGEKGLMAEASIGGQSFSYKPM